jgi:hypothetical protein
MYKQDDLARHEYRRKLSQRLGPYPVSTALPPCSTPASATGTFPTTQPNRVRLTHQRDAAGRSRLVANRAPTDQPPPDPEATVLDTAPYGR